MTTDDETTLQEIIESWLNGNISWTYQKVKNLPPSDIARITYLIFEQHGQSECNRFVSNIDAREYEGNKNV